MNISRIPYRFHRPANQFIRSMMWIPKYIVIIVASAAHIWALVVLPSSSLYTHTTNISFPSNSSHHHLFLPPDPFVVHHGNDITTTEFYGYRRCRLIDALEAQRCTVPAYDEAERHFANDGGLQPIGGFRSWACAEGRAHLELVPRAEMTWGMWREVIANLQGHWGYPAGYHFLVW